ncbi:MAG TPA: DUF6350 family protein [Propionibacteriaceae bacterium]
MASLLSPRRPDTRRPDPEGRERGGLRLRVTRLVERKAPRSDGDLASPPLPWPLVAVVGGLATAAISWVAWVGIAVLGWVSAEPGTFAGATLTGTDLWLLSNGVSARIGSIAVTLVPWGATAVAAFVLSRFAAFAARQVRPEQTAGPGVISVASLSGYLLPVLVVAVLRGEPWQAPAHWGAVIVILAAAAAWGSSRALGQALLPSWPAWARAVPRAVVGTQVVMLAAGAAVVASGLWLHQDRVVALNEALDPGVAGGIALLVGQLAFAPNLCVWAASYALGAGFTLGNGSVVAPAGSEMGIVPGIPVFGALPAAGPGGTLLLWWLAAGVLAGVVAALLVVRARPDARFDETSLVGGLAGLVGGLTFVGLAWAASGDLGALRLAGLGPRLLPVLVMSVTTMGLAGMITGLLMGLLRLRRRS